MTLGLNNTMTVDLKPYPEYKETSTPWINRLPQHWELFKVKYIFRERVEKGFENEVLLAATQIKGVVPKNLYANRTVVAFKDLHLLKLVEIGDFVISLRSFQGGIEYAYYRGIISPAYTIMVLRSEYEHRYFVHLFKSLRFIHNLRLFVTGIRQGQNIDYFKFKNSLLSIPPVEEQKQIAKFLDTKLNFIFRYIKNKRKLIKLLNEKKQAIINQAVTRGINSDVRMKTSGIDWLGDIPEHWKVNKIKRVCSYNPSKLENNLTTENDNKVVFLPMEAISTAGRILKQERKSISEVWSGFSYFRKGDVVVAKITPCFENGKGAYLNELETEFGFGTTEFIVLRPHSKMKGKYLYYLTTSSKFRFLGKEHMTGSAGQKRVSLDFINNYPIAVPQIDEQDLIIEYITKAENSYDTTIQHAEKEIKLIREYRVRLISDIVTGKIDVRNIKIDDIKDSEMLEEIVINDEIIQEN